MDTVLNSTFKLVKAVSHKFLASATKFHYNFNMRELASIVEGLCLANPKAIRTPMALARLWLHESYRTLGDRMVSKFDLKQLRLLIVEQTKADFMALPQEELHAEPNIFTNFVAKDDEREQCIYSPIKGSNAGFQRLRDVLVEKLDAYNKVSATT